MMPEQQRKGANAAAQVEEPRRLCQLPAHEDHEPDRGPDFLRLANALSALYPRDSEEKRLLDAMLLAVAR